jgi:hypothetical protein
MRRRLWWQICILDTQGMSDRGSDPIIIDNSFSTQLPLNINDEDLFPGNQPEVQARESYTDTTLSLVTHEVFDAERRLNYVPAKGNFPGEEQAAEIWAQRRAWVTTCQRRIEDKYLQHCNMNIPIQRFTRQIADIMIARLWLWAYRPLQRHPNSPTAANIPYPGILHLSVEVLEKAMRVPLDPAFRPFLWIVNIWVQWHALAVMIAELCVQTEGPTVERAWTLANSVFDETARHVADSDTGRLWRPIKKLMNKAQAVRKQHLEDVGHASGLAPVGLDTQYVNARSLQPGGGDTLNNAMEWTTEQPQLYQGWERPNQAQQPQQILQSPMNVEWTSINWDGWPNGTTIDQFNPGNELNQMSWNDWELFVDDFQASGDFLPGQESLEQIQ